MAARHPFRVCAIGAECTGKTTLAHAVGAAFGAPVVEEYSRDYFAEKLARGDASVFPGDLVRVIAEQARREDAVALDAGRLMVCDTDVLTVAIWHERYLGGRRPEIDQLAQMRVEQGAGMDLYLLCLPDFPFAPDEVRTGEPLRTSMHEVFVERLEEAGVPFIRVGGSTAERLKLATETIENLLSARAT